MSDLHSVAAGEELLDLARDLGGQAVAGMLGVGRLLDNGRESETGLRVIAVTPWLLRANSTQIKHGQTIKGEQ